MEVRFLMTTATPTGQRRRFRDGLYNNQDMARPVIEDMGFLPDRESLRRWYPLLLFNVFLFFTGVGSMFFRMARDNDDVVRTGLILASGALCTLILASGRVRIPAALAVPALGYALTQFASAFASVNVVESLK